MAVDVAEEEFYQRLWQPPVPLSVISFVSYSAAAEYTARRLLAEIRGQAEYLHHETKRFSTRLVHESGRVCRAFRVKASASELRPYVWDIDVRTPVGTFRIPADIALTQRNGNGFFGQVGVVGALEDKLAAYMAEIKRHEPEAIRQVASKLGLRQAPLQNGHFYNFYKDVYKL